MCTIAPSANPASAHFNRRDPSTFEPSMVGGIATGMQTQKVCISPPVICTFFGDHSGKRCQLGCGPCGLLHPIICSNPYGRKIRFLHLNESKPRVSSHGRSFLGELSRKDGIFARKKGKRRFLLGGSSRGFGFNDGGGGRGWSDSNNRRVLGNLALAVGLTYLSMTGKFGWLLDAVVSIWLLAVLLPTLGLGAFLWFASRDMVQDSCPNCGNDFQILSPFQWKTTDLFGHLLIQNMDQYLGKVLMDFHVVPRKRRLPLGRLLTLKLMLETLIEVLH